MYAFVFLVLLTSVGSLALGVEFTRQELKYGYPIYRGTCDVECKPEEGCRGSGPGDCFSCRHYFNKKSVQCVETCENGTNLTEYPECFVCPEECLGGCHGPAVRLCRECKHFRNVDTEDCVKTCAVATLYYSNGKYCGACHAECVRGCAGPADSQCFGCKHKKRRVSCVEECDDDEYTKKDDEDLGSNECKKCHEDCVWRCSGPDNTEGEGGCTACPKPVMIRPSWPKKDDLCFNQTCYRFERCLLLNDTCPDSYYEGILPSSSDTVGKLAKFAGKRACLSCHQYCLECTSYGFNPRICQKCKHPNCYCPVGTYFEQFVDGCVKCRDECKECTNHSSCTNCGGEYKYRIYDERYPSINGSFTCMKECPPFQRFSYFSELYQNYCMSVNLTEESTSKPQKYESKDIIAAITVSISLAVVVLGVVFWRIMVYLLAKNKSNEVNFVIEHNQTLENDEEPLVSSNIAPNRNKLRIIAENDVIKTEVLGNGAFGVVYRGFLLREGCNAQDPVAIKVLNPQSKETSTKDFLHEATIMGRVNHVNLLPLLAICVTSNVMLVTELMPLGDLLHYLHEHYRKIKPKTMVNWCLQIAKGMDYLEKDSLVHRDLAARNVLLQSAYRVKITDFGLTQALKIDQGMYKSTGGKLPVKWLALESLKTGIFTHKTDVWSFGVTVWEVLTYGEEPYESCTTLVMLRETLDAGRRLGQPDSCSSVLYTVLVTCWAEDATARPSFQDLVDTFSKMITDPGRCIIELKDARNKSAPEPLPRHYYQNVDDTQPDACRYENACMETHVTANSSCGPVAPMEVYIPPWLHLLNT